MLGSAQRQLFYVSTWMPTEAFVGNAHGQEEAAIKQMYDACSPQNFNADPDRCRVAAEYVGHYYGPPGTPLARKPVMTELAAEGGGPAKAAANSIPGAPPITPPGLNPFQAAAATYALGKPSVNTNTQICTK